MGSLRNISVKRIIIRGGCVARNFLAGGGEDNEKPLEAAKRGVWEEAGVQTMK